jgi:hypothetical protein
MDASFTLTVSLVLRKGSPVSTGQEEPLQVPEKINVLPVAPDGD